MMDWGNITGPVSRSLAAVSSALISFLRRFGAWLACSLIAAVGALVFFSWLAEEVLEGETRAFDETARSIVRNYASPTLTSFMQQVTWLGSVTWLIAFGICVAIAFIVAKWWRDVALLTVTMVGAIALNITLKLIFRRARPESFFETPLPSSYSFPSGHALLSLCFYGIVASIIAPHLKRRFVRPLIWATAVLLIALIGFSRIYLGVHYPTDVLGSYAVALFWVVMVSTGDHIYDWRNKRHIEKKVDK
jgi:undecaprenyl-diphosphatase